MLKPRLPQRGVNIIELMVVISIVSILMAVGIPQMQSWTATSRLRLKAEGLLNGLQLARVEALRRNTRVFFTFNTDTSWTLGCVTFVADNDADGVADCPATIQSKSADEGGSAVVATVLPDAATTATFTGIGLTRANDDGSATLTQVDFSTTGTTQTYRVLLNAGGQARLCDPAVSTSGNPNLC